MTPHDHRTFVEFFCNEDTMIIHATSDYRRTLCGRPVGRDWISRGTRHWENGKAGAQCIRCRQALEST